MINPAMFMPYMSGTNFMSRVTDPFARLNKEDREAAVAAQKERIAKIADEFVKDGKIIDQEGYNRACDACIAERDADIRARLEASGIATDDAGSASDSSFSGDFGSVTRRPKNIKFSSPIGEDVMKKAQVTAEIQAFRKELADLNKIKTSDMSKEEVAKLIVKKEIYKAGISGLEKLMKDQTIADTPEARKTFQEQLKKVKKQVLALYAEKYGDKEITDANAKTVFDFINGKNFDFVTKDKKGKEIKLDKKIGDDKKEAGKKLKKAKEFFGAAETVKVNGEDKKQNINHEYLTGKSTIDINMGLDRTKNMAKHLETALKNLDDEDMFSYTVNGKTHTISKEALQDKLKEIKKLMHLQKIVNASDETYGGSNIVMFKFYKDYGEDKKVEDTDKERHRYINNLSDMDLLKLVKNKGGELETLLQAGLNDEGTHGLIIKRLVDIRRRALGKDAFATGNLAKYKNIESFAKNKKKADSIKDLEAEYQANETLGEQFDNNSHWTPLYDELTCDL